ncbi:MAG: phosphate/phosphite/phosphonate ABC transporter substrate-binding protein [Acidobacteria bacterium]|nr:phosphate/phosphite/phosphonate ABC transporter substrate-binding protein [Acidobacteriota bacterium]
MISRPSARVRHFGTFAAVLAIAGLAGGCRQQAPEARQQLVIAVQPTATAEQLAAESKELEQFLESRLPGVDVELRVPTLFAGVIEALRFGHAHAAFMSAWPAVLAQKHAGAEVALAEVRQVLIDGEEVERPFYFSYWVVMPGSRYETLADLKGRRVAFPSPLSTSGYVMPMAKLVERELVAPDEGEADPEQFFGQVLFAGGYAQAWQALKSGQVDATVIAGDVPAVLYNEVLGATRIIESQGPIPSHAVVFGKTLEEPLRSQLRDALMALGEPEHRVLMRKFISGIFVRFQPATTSEHLAALQQSLQATNLQYTERLR